MEPNLAESIYIRSSLEFLHFVPFRQQIVDSFSKSTKEVFNVQGSLALSKHPTHYGPWSGFPYHNPTTPYRESTTYLPPEQFYGMSHGNCHQYLDMSKKINIHKSLTITF
jgi:hypothetical protein